MKNGSWIWAILVVALAGCSAGDHGALRPLADDGVTLVSTHGLPDDTARLTADGITADVNGLWSEQGESIEIGYKAGPSPLSITMQSDATWQGQTARASAAWDRSVRDGGNAIGRPLPDGSSLRIAGGESKTVQIDYGRASTDRRPKIGDEVTITIPMPAGPRQARFRISGE